MTVSTAADPMSSQEIVRLSRAHTFFSWSVQGTLDPIAIDRAEGVYLAAQVADTWTTDYHLRLPASRFLGDQAEWNPIVQQLAFHNGQYRRSRLIAFKGEISLVTIAAAINAYRSETTHAHLYTTMILTAGALPFAGAALSNYCADHSDVCLAYWKKKK